MKVININIGNNRITDGVLKMMHHNNVSDNSDQLSIFSNLIVFTEILNANIIQF